MKILIVGGGSGGHVTPAISVAREILKLRPKAKIEFWTDRKYVKNVEKITTLGEDEGQLRMRVRKISAGKFRRYSGWKFVDYFKLWKITIGDLILKNIGNCFLFLFGFLESLFRLASHENRPDVIFLKGGYVGLPVGMAAQILRIPYIIHESDAAAGLANRLLAKRAKIIATGFSMKNAGEKYRFVGIPVGDEFRKVSEREQKKFKKALGFSDEKSLVIITGGSQGSERINRATLEILPSLLEIAEVGIVVGRKHKEMLEEFRKFEIYEKGKLTGGFRAWEFNSNMRELLGAADVVVSRAGATTIAELSALGKATILVPFEALPNSHQTRNADRLAEAGAVQVVSDEKMVKKPEELLDTIQKLVRRPAERKRLAERLREEISQEGKGAAGKLAEMVVEVGGGRI